MCFLATFQLKGSELCHEQASPFHPFRLVSGATVVLSSTAATAMHGTTKEAQKRAFETKGSNGKCCINRIALLLSVGPCMTSWSNTWVWLIVIAELYFLDIVGLVRYTVVQTRYSFRL